MKNCVENSMTYAGYVKLIDDLLAEGKTTGPNQSEAMVGYGKLNRQRMRRIEKTLATDPSAVEALRNIDRPQIWLIITEGWCGDAAQNVPVIERLAAESGRIETRYVLRDENLELMDRFLTNGGRSIPKLIALDAETLEVVGDWGPRPQPALELFAKLKADGVEKAEILEQIQRWYIADKNQTVQREVAALAKKQTALSAS